MKKVLRFLDEKNPWADDVAFRPHLRENFRAYPLRKMAAIVNATMSGTVKMMKAIERIWSQLGRARLGRDEAEELFYHV